VDHETEAELSKYAVDAAADLQDRIGKEPDFAGYGKCSVCFYANSN
jgi:hypothetical protein